MACARGQRRQSLSARRVWQHDYELVACTPPASVYFPQRRVPADEISTADAADNRQPHLTGLVYFRVYLGRAHERASTPRPLHGCL